MKIIIISDTHGSCAVVHKILEKEKNTEAIIFLGDGIRDICNVEIEYPHITVYKVMGNCDFFSNDPTKCIIEIDGVKIFFTHGHLYYVKSNYNSLLNEAGKNNADIALFGHTHSQLNKKINGINLFNPGSVSGNRCQNYGCGYGVLVIENGKYTLENRVM